MDETLEMMWNDFSPDQQLLLLILREAEPDGLPKEVLEEKYLDYVDRFDTVEDAVEYLMTKVTIH